LSSTTAHLANYPARYFAAWNQRDIDVALAVIADDIEWIDPSLPEPLTDRAGAKWFFESAWAAFPDIVFEPVGQPLVDERLGRVAHEWVMRGNYTGSGFPPGVEPTGNRFELGGCDVWNVDASGRAVRVRAFYDAGDFVRQLGLA